MFEPPSEFHGNPFAPGCGPAAFFASRAHHRACEAMREALESAELAVLAGEPGIGKTTTIEAFLRSLAGRPVLARRVQSARIDAVGALQAIGEAFGLALLAGGTRRLLIVVEDAQGLSAASLAELGPMRPALCRLAALEPDEIRGYVEQRLRGAGWKSEPRFDPQALALIHAYSGGNPARINRICAGALPQLEDAGRFDALAVQRAAQAA